MSTYGYHTSSKLFVGVAVQGFDHELYPIGAACITSNDSGMRLFTKLRNTFRSSYPECVADHVKFNDEL